VTHALPENEFAYVLFRFRGRAHGPYPQGPLRNHANRTTDMLWSFIAIYTRRNRARLNPELPGEPGRPRADPWARQWGGPAQR